MKPQDREQQRIALIGDRHWPVEHVVDHYGYPATFLDSLGLVDAERVDRFDLERKLLVHHGLLSIKLAAAELGVTEDTVHIAMERGFHAPDMAIVPPFPIANAETGAKLVIRDQLDSWVRQITGFNGTWPSISTRSEKLVERLNAIEPGVAELLLDVVSNQYNAVLAQALGRQVAPFTASTYCIITNQPVALPFTEMLRVAGREKPINLPPDRAGWHALWRYPDLVNHVLGSNREFLGLRI